MSTTPLDDMDFAQCFVEAKKMDKSRLRPALLSVLAGVHWKKLAEKGVYT